MSIQDIIEKVVTVVPDTINAVGNTADKMADALNKVIDDVDRVLESPFKVGKNIIHSVDKMKERRIENIKKANINLTDEDIENMKQAEEEIKKKKGNKIYELSDGDLFVLEQMNAMKKSNGIENGGNLKGQIENAVDNIKEVEMKQNVFQNSNINQQFQRINSTLENHKGRIGVLEGTAAKHGQILANHEGRIGKLENIVDQHSKKIWKYC
jgi:DNA anti-recombination protein RmuC